MKVLPKNNKPSYLECASFRPISVLPTLSKLVNKNRLEWFVNNNTWVSEAQYGFISGRATQTACASLGSYIEENFGAKKYIAGIFIDIKGAFDSAWRLAILATFIKRDCPIYLLKILAS